MPVTVASALCAWGFELGALAVDHAELFVWVWGSEFTVGLN